MKIKIRTYDLAALESEPSFSEREVKDLATAEKEIKVGEKIHICRHDEGKSCSLI